MRAHGWSNQWHVHRHKRLLTGKVATLPPPSTPANIPVKYVNLDFQNISESSERHLKHTTLSQCVWFEYPP